MINNDKIIIIDIEATCWEKEAPVDQESDIIEIGLAVLNIKTGEIEENTSYLITPERSTVSAFCTKLTGWTQEKVNHGMRYHTAINHLRKTYQTKKRAWASYGEYDRKMINNQCQFSESPYPFSQQHLNIKEMVNLFNGGTKMLGLGQALKKAGLEFEGTPHRGQDDAYNIARLLRHFILGWRKDKK